MDRGRDSPVHYAYLVYMVADFDNNKKGIQSNRVKSIETHRFH